MIKKKSRLTKLLFLRNNIGSYQTVKELKFSRRVCINKLQLWVNYLAQSLKIADSVPSHFSLFSTIWNNHINNNVAWVTLSFKKCFRTINRNVVNQNQDNFLTKLLISLWIVLSEKNFPIHLYLTEVVIECKRIKIKKL